MDNGGDKSDTIPTHHWLNDLKSGFIVSLMAIPMSIGIAIASGCPPFSGLISAIIGGIAISFMMGSPNTIKGPAGGLSAIVLSSIITFGSSNLIQGYVSTLAITSLAGVCIMVLGLLRFGRLSDFIPASAIHGMMAALGLILAVKQLPIMLGADMPQYDALLQLTTLHESIEKLNPKIALIGLISLAIMIAHGFIPYKNIKAIPAPVFVLFICIPLSFYLNIYNKHSYIFNIHTYEIIPQKVLIHLNDNMWSNFYLPDFYTLTQPQAWLYVVMFTLAISIESLLTNKAIEKIDLHNRVTNQNKDLFAVGLANVLSGLVGGLPLISESKRSIININNGGTRHYSNFYHGMFVLFIVITASALLKYIPLASLAGMLVYTGAKLATPSEISKTYKIGKEQFLVFITTFVISIYSNFLYGILCGILVELMINIYYGVNVRQLFEPLYKIRTQNNEYEIQFTSPALFSNYMPFAKSLISIPESSNIIFDFSASKVIDHTFLEHLYTLEQRKAQYGGQIALVGLDYHKHLSHHPLASKRIQTLKYLDARQRKLKKISEDNGYIFEPRLINQNTKYAHFTFADQTSVIHEQNVVKTIHKSTEIQCADIKLQTRSKNMMAQDYEFTLIHIYELPASVPEFVLRKEGFADTIFSLAGYNDIDFDEYPSFSYYYYLKGKNENHIRSFFSQRVIKFFEENKGYHIESAHHALIIYKRTELLKTEEIAEAIEYACKLTDILYSATKVDI
ncbi:MAG: SulP family inorganic anion transporter [Cytophagales bacterium]|nr:SulP family inorganic anion transporter [Cytophagales bacterium]